MSARWVAFLHGRRRQHVVQNISYRVSAHTSTHPGRPMGEPPVNRGQWRAFEHASEFMVFTASR